MTLQIIVIVAIVILAVLWFVMRKKGNVSSDVMDSGPVMAESSEEEVASEPVMEESPMMTESSSEEVIEESSVDNVDVAEEEKQQVQ